MAGRRQHYIPRFLQRGFLAERDTVAERTYLHRRDAQPTLVGIRDVGVGEDFYSKFTGDGRRWLRSHTDDVRAPVMQVIDLHELLPQRRRSDKTTRSGCGVLSSKRLLRRRPAKGVPLEAHAYLLAGMSIRRELRSDRLCFSQRLTPLKSMSARSNSWPRQVRLTDSWPMSRSEAVSSQGPAASPHLLGDRGAVSTSANLPATPLTIFS